MPPKKPRVHQGLGDGGAGGGQGKERRALGRGRHWTPAVPANPLCSLLRNRSQTNTHPCPPGPRAGLREKGRVSCPNSCAHPATGSAGSYRNAFLLGSCIQPPSASRPLQAPGPVLSPGGPGSERDRYVRPVFRGLLFSVAGGGRQGRTDAEPRRSVCGFGGSALRPLASSFSGHIPPSSTASSVH